MTKTDLNTIKKVWGGYVPDEDVEAEYEMLCECFGFSIIDTMIEEDEEDA